MNADKLIKYLSEFPKNSRIWGEYEGRKERF